jgi:hypothetical protein
MSMKVIWTSHRGSAVVIGATDDRLAIGLDSSSSAELVEEDAVRMAWAIIEHFATGLCADCRSAPCSCPRGDAAFEEGEAPDGTPVQIPTPRFAEQEELVALNEEMIRVTESHRQAIVNTMSTVMHLQSKVATLEKKLGD